MSKDDIGVWTIYLSIPTVLELLRNGFIRNPLISHLTTAESEDERGRLITASWILHTILVLITTGILVAGAYPIAATFKSSSQLVPLFYVYALRSLVLIPCLQFEYLQQSQANFKAIFLANIARLAPTAIYLCFKFIEHRFFHPVEVTLYDIAVVQLISAIASVWVGYIFLRGSTIIYPKIDMGLVRMLSGFGKYTMGTTISSTVIKNTDTWMIGVLISTVGVASYNPALRISNLIEVPTLAVANLVYPQVGRKMAESGKQGVQDVYIKSVSLILAMILPGLIPLYILSDYVITVIFTNSYSDAAPILRVTLFFTMIIPFNRQFGTVMDALKRPKINFYLLVAMCVINVFFCFMFLGRYGVIGAAYATLLSYCIIFVLNQVILYRMYEINTFKVFPAIIDWYRTGWNLFRTRILKTT